MVCQATFLKTSANQRPLSASVDQSEARVMAQHSRPDQHRYLRRSWYFLMSSHTQYPPCERENIQLRSQPDTDSVQKLDKNVIKGLTRGVTLTLMFWGRKYRTFLEFNRSFFSSFGHKRAPAIRLIIKHFQIKSN